MINPYAQLIGYLKSGVNIQTGSLLHTFGSAPQIPGAMAIFEKEQVLNGTLGGGLLEANAQKIAAASVKTRQNYLQSVDFTAGVEEQTGAICGGSALFLLDADPSKHLEVYQQLLDSIGNQQCGVLVTVISDASNQYCTIERSWFQLQDSLPENMAQLLKSAEADLRQIIGNRTPFYKEITGEIPSKRTHLFIEPIHPFPQLLLVGAGHIGKALCKICSMVDFEITLLDDRPEMTIPSGFPDATRIICTSLAEAFQSVKLTPDTYIVIATQGHRTDMEALRCCIGSDAAYIGVIGSKRKIALMKQKFMDERWATAEEWNFVHTPVGIEIHSRSVNEIAISIVAELVKERYEINYLRKQKMVSSILLAAGKSTRMGQQKLLMPYKGHGMVDHILQKITNTNLFRTIVVTGSDSAQIEKELKNHQAIFVYNERFEEGMLSSVQKGIAALGVESAGFLILLGDQPMVTEKVINRLIALFRKTTKGLLVPTFLGKRGHPVLIDAKYRDEIGKLSQAIGLRELFLNHPEDVLEVEIESDAILKDIDTPEDYRRETED